MKNSVVTGIEPTMSGLLDQRRSRSNNQAPSELGKFVASKGIIREEEV